MKVLLIFLLVLTVSLALANLWFVVMGGASALNVLALVVNVVASGMLVTALSER